jgi:ATP-dependent DNA helicase PIF1
MSGLEPVVFLAKGARVMLTMNLWSSVGLCNGATGTVVDIIYHNNHQPPDLPIAVMVEFENYRGPLFEQNQPLCIPICPITVTSHTEVGLHERQQVPLRLAWALTIHKSQGLTLPKAWIDIGKSERTAGVSYVAISRVKSLTSCVIEPMTYERLIYLNKPLSLHSKWDHKYRS